MGKYAVEMNRTSSTTASLGGISADATRPRRSRLYMLSFGAEATPADQALKWIVQRFTAAGTSTGVTPQPLDPADAATESDAGENHTVEPTYTAGAILLAVALNQKATFLWQTLPEMGLVIPATASNGLGIQTPVISSGTPAITATAHFEEQ
jgi:hypothetical protein